MTKFILEETCKEIKINESWWPLGHFSAVTEAFNTVNDRWTAVILSADTATFKTFLFDQIF